MIDIEAHKAATASLSTLLARGDDMHAPKFYDLLARRLVANALLVRGYLAPVVDTSDPIQLKQQRQAGLSEREKVEEDLYYAKRDVADLEATLTRMLAFGEGHDPDQREQDREDDRAREARQDEAAREAAPELAS